MIKRLICMIKMSMVGAGVLAAAAASAWEPEPPAAFKLGGPLVGTCTAAQG